MKTGPSIAFADTEIDPGSGRILDLGSIKENKDTFHSGSVAGFTEFLQGTRFLCGHNIINHDLNYISHAVEKAGIDRADVIDTLFLSPLLFPVRPYHALLKDDKLQTEDINNPLNDSIKARDLFHDEVEAFKQADNDLKQIFFSLLHDKQGFQGFFRYLGFRADTTACIAPLIFKKFHLEICNHADLEKIVTDFPVALAYCLSLVHTDDHYSITPPWVLKTYPEIEQVMVLLRNNPCLRGCDYCNQALDIHRGLKKFFKFNSYRAYGGEALQEQAVQAAVDRKSILAVFPTGGGKSIAFQVPALMSGENARGLTIVISPLQSLMKDQVDNLEKAGITNAVTINGLLDPIERGKSFERVENGTASILYISPESLRSRTIEHVILKRNIVRFVIDEAHCFSSWGQDFRVDYLYIGDFIKAIQDKKHLEDKIPVSCFTATAKQKVIQDIKAYFKDNLELDLEIFNSNASRTNLQYKVFFKDNEEEKYHSLRDLMDQKKCPTIIYVSRTYRAFELAERLTADGYHAKPYHGKMDKNKKMENQDAFIRGDVDIMVATSAFGMGVDKKDVGMVIHYEISDSLENYVQEAGRAGRDENITADCFVLFNEEDLGKHFILLNQTRLNVREIQQVWKAVKEITRFRSRASNSALEIARKAGWDDNIDEIETRVKTAIAALENAGYLKRGQNMPRIYANSILAKNAQEAIDRITASERFEEKQKQHAVRIIKKLFSSKTRKQADDETAESRVDYISDHLGIVKEDVIHIITRLREEKILADAKDLTAFIKKGEKTNRSLNIVQKFADLETFLLTRIEQQETIFHIKELNEQAEESGCRNVNPATIKTIINFWAIKNWIKRSHHGYSKNTFSAALTQPKEEFKHKLEKRHELAQFIVELLYERSKKKSDAGSVGKSSEDKFTIGGDLALIEFSVLELKAAYESGESLFRQKTTIDEIEDTLFYLSRIGAIRIEGGFLVAYNRLTIERLEKDNRRRYKNEDYKKLGQFYENKVEQIHIVGEYARKMIRDYKAALQFVEDYFQLNYASFLRRYFKGSRGNEIKRNITPAKFRQLFGELSAAQLNIINDNKTQYMVVAAGPGSGKTRILVHKLASLLLMEDVKHEQLLMVTFSRAAATEFKKRLIALIGNAANFIEIKTFHSYCFDLLGKIGSLEKSGEIIKKTIAKIKDGQVEPARIAKAVLVIDEAQDMDADEYELINVLADQNPDMRIIAVGDDDQNIYEFRGSSSKHLEQLISEKNAVMHQLVENYRSKNNLVEFTNNFAKKIRRRLKENPIIARQADCGQIKIVRYKSRNLITPLVQDLLSTRLKGTTCVLTHTNEEALQAQGLLLENKMPAKLIQTNEGFNLYNLLEIRYFLDRLTLREDTFIINDELWKAAKRSLWNEFKDSSKMDICIKIIKGFEAANPRKKYRSDFEIFVRESKLEDFSDEPDDSIFVSTMHKAKGREFDHVFLMLDHFDLINDGKKRLVYVAMTRAKQNLTIHLNSNFMDDISAQKMERINNNEKQLPPDQLVMHLGHREIWLDYFMGRQFQISQMKSGDELILRENRCLDKGGVPVLIFSRSFSDKLETFRQAGYTPIRALVNYIVYWQKEDFEKEIKIILPELYLKKPGTDIAASDRATLNPRPT
ncbi:RecQ family ATP-dependent DNA helicase [Desulfospira joergensenii]|uniref:RecQ family ATP-dependent DNA helicase n=1 Tax=Desulfospira joergensenii TaxID=53329 RepID=UPI0003B4E008|nr:RecQ family ATP-dependent DNA helicase [Desulfospira joergensenii]